MKDKRFSIAAKLIRTNEIKTFSEIIDIVPKTVVAKELGINPERFNRLLATIDLFVVKDCPALFPCSSAAVACSTVCFRDCGSRRHRRYRSGIFQAGVFFLNSGYFFFAQRAALSIVIVMDRPAVCILLDVIHSCIF
jgi:hypothetical protein